MHCKFQVLKILSCLFKFETVTPTPVSENMEDKGENTSYKEQRKILRQLERLMLQGQMTQGIGKHIRGGIGTR